MAENKPKRQIKNPETFRERAIKASDQKVKPPTRLSKLKASFRAIGRIFAPLAKLKKVKQLKPLFAVFRFLGRIFYPKYIRTSVAELKLVTWPSFKQSRKLTYAVIVFATVFGVSVAIVDWGLGKIFRHLLLK